MEFLRSFLRRHLAGKPVVAVPNVRCILRLNEQDHWNHKILKIADVTFRKIKDCGRCSQTTVDPEKGIKDAGLEPLKTLRKFRLFKDSDPRHEKAPFFGAQMAPDCEGTIKIGDPVFISC